jgi:hypothetical protein
VAIAPDPGLLSEGNAAQDCRVFRTGVFQRPIKAINQSFITKRLLQERSSSPVRISASV